MNVYSCYSLCDSCDYEAMFVSTDHACMDLSRDMYVPVCLYACIFACVWCIQGKIWMSAMGHRTARCMMFLVLNSFGALPRIFPVSIGSSYGWSSLFSPCDRRSCDA